MPRTGYLFSETCIDHDPGRGHPERPERLMAVRDAVDAAKLALTPVDIVSAVRADLRRNHTADHVDTIEETCRTSAPYPDPDTTMIPASWDAALLAAGAGVTACRAVLDGEVDNAFCAVRPPGHHCEADRAMGFCLFNSIAIAARWLREERGIKRVAIFDWDVHHGNGTQHSFYDDDSVYYASIHQHPLYPGTGDPAERGAGNCNLNIRMAYGNGPTEWLAAMDEQVLPEFQRFDPEVLLISAGFDAHERDPLGGQRLTTETFAEMTRKLMPLANGRIVSMMEGGYDLKGLADSVVAHLRVLNSGASEND
jgi:acetoin utilization deacetylase AcuC-like enzyme